MIILVPFGVQMTNTIKLLIILNVSIDVSLYTYHKHTSPTNFVPSIFFLFFTELLALPIDEDPFFFLIHGTLGFWNRRRIEVQLCCPGYSPVERKFFGM